jgi:hypothetical protein
MLRTFLVLKLWIKINSNKEKVEILLIRGECGKHLARAQQLYVARYPEKP